MADDKPVQIVVAKTNPIDDLSSLMLKLYVSFKFDNPELFFAKLGDIMTSNSTIDVSVLKAKFVNLVANSTGTLHKVGAITPQELNSNLTQPRISVVDLSAITDATNTSILPTPRVSVSDMTEVNEATDGSLVRSSLTDSSDVMQIVDGSTILSQSVDTLNTKSPQYNMESVNTYVGDPSSKVNKDPNEIVADIGPEVNLQYGSLQADNGNKILNPARNVDYTATTIPAYSKDAKDIFNAADPNKVSITPKDLTNPTPVSVKLGGSLVSKGDTITSLGIAFVPTDGSNIGTSTIDLNGTKAFEFNKDMQNTFTIENDVKVNKNPNEILDVSLINSEILNPARKADYTTGISPTYSIKGKEIKVTDTPSYPTEGKEVDVSGYVPVTLTQEQINITDTPIYPTEGMKTHKGKFIDEKGITRINYKDPKEIFNVNESSRRINRPNIDLSATPIPVYEKQGDTTAQKAIAAAAANIYRQAFNNGNEKAIDTFLYNVVPYLAGSVVNGALSIWSAGTTAWNDATSAFNSFSDPASTKDFKTTVATFGGSLNKLASTLSAGLGVLSNWNILSGIAKYFSYDELAWLLVADFYSIFYNRGIKVKDLINLSAPMNSSVTIGNLPFEIANKNTIVLGIRGGTNVANPKDRSELLPFLKNLSAELALQGINSPAFTKGYNGNRANEIPGSTFNQSVGNGSQTIPVDVPTGSFLNDDNLRSTAYNAVYNGREFDQSQNTKNLGEFLTRNKYGAYQIGQICIFPLNGDKVGFAPTRIPFEFNPVIVEGDVQARYASQQILSRIGDLFSFTGISSQVITVTAAYQALSKSGEDDYILGLFTMDNIVAIENSYRSLILPYFPASTETTTSEGQKYVRPPYIKIVMGNSEVVNDDDVNTDTAYSTLLRYPISIANSAITKFKTYKTFIATSVKINRNEDAPFLIEENPQYGYVLKNYMGFSVELSLTEVSPGYAEALPTFADYYTKGIGLGV